MAETYSATYAGAIAASTTKTFLAWIPGATQTGRLITVEASFDASAPATGILVQIVRFTTDGTGTTYTPLRVNGEGQNRAALTPCKVNYSADPTTPTVAKQWYLPNTGGQFIQLPLGREFYIPVSTVTGIRLVTPAGASGNVSVNSEIEE
jgi:hypothetical protein